jgi:hypothetical protein
MVDFPKFLTTASELYDLWPALFNWTAGIAGTILSAAVAATWWVRGFKADADLATGEAEKAALKGQIDVLTQRLSLATEQQKVATEQAKHFETQLSELKAKAAAGGPAKEKELADLALSLDRFLTANNAVTTTLTTSRGATIVPPRTDR